MNARSKRVTDSTHRRSFIGGSDARIMTRPPCCGCGRNGAKPSPRILSGNLIVQLGLATEELNRRWYEANSGQAITDIRQQVRHPTVRWTGATLDGRVEAIGAVFEAKFMWAIPFRAFSPRKPRFQLAT